MTQSIPLGSDARERFLLEIAAVVPPHRVSEVHFFAPLRQGPMETGVAVVAATPEGALVGETASQADEAPIEEPQYPEGAHLSSRHVVYSASYRWTRKGPERGKWESEVVAEADAPLLTVDTVVKGVMQRSAEPLEVERLDGDTVRAMIEKALERWPTTP
jgi:hypothetical protein